MQVPTSQYPAAAPQEWWLLAIAGIVNILFGIAALAWPGLTLFVLVWLFGIFAIIYGIVELVNVFRAMGQRATWWTHLLVGVISIIAGIVVFAWPLITTVTLLYVIAIWAIVIGIVEIGGSLFTGQWFLAVAGLISVLFGFVLFANPLVGAVALVMVIGIFAIVRGILLIVEAIRAPAAPTRPAMP